MDYKNAGVDIEAGYKAVELMKEHIAGTMRSEVLTDIGGFSGAFSMEAFKTMEQPTLVSGTDGVGTKLKVAFEMATIPLVLIVSQCVLMTSPVQVVNRYSSLIILPVARMNRKRLLPSYPVWQTAANSPVQL